MRISVLGTGMVGRAIAARLDGLGHDVAIGTRDPAQTVGRTDPADSESYSDWQAAHPSVRLLPFAEAGAFGEVVVNVTHGAVSVAALEAVGASNLAGKVLWDIGLPLDLSQGLPPMLTIANDDSLAEQIQRAFPEARVVKALNTVYFEVMIEPGRVPGPHSIFVAGEDPSAKDVVRGLLNEFGWTSEVIIDLGGIRGARGAEMYSRLFFELYSALGTFDFNIAVVRA